MSDKISIDSIPATRNLVERLHRENWIDSDARIFSLELLYPSKNWAVWISQLLLFLGTTLLLVGILFFFAFNWSIIPKWAKLGSIELGIVLCLVLAFRKGLEKLSAKVLLLAASVLIGIFLATFGQIYQTGADAYQLFLGWFMFILPWTIISKFNGLWLLWLILVNTFVILYWEQNALRYVYNPIDIFLWLALLNGAFLCIKEYFYARGVEWLSAKWMRWLLIFSIFSLLFVMINVFIWKGMERTNSFGLLVSIIAHPLAYWYYLRKKPDIYSLSLIILSFCLILESIFARGLLDRHFNSESLLVMSIVTIIIFTCAIKILRGIAEKLEVQS